MYHICTNLHRWEYKSCEKNKIENKKKSNVSQMQRERKSNRSRKERVRNELEQQNVKETLFI